MFFGFIKFGTFQLYIYILQTRCSRGCSTNTFVITYFIIVVIGTKVSKQETELLPTANKKLTQPPKLTY